MLSRFNYKSSRRGGRGTVECVFQVHGEESTRRRSEGLTRKVTQRLRKNGKSAQRFIPRPGASSLKTEQPPPGAHFWADQLDLAPPLPAVDAHPPRTTPSSDSWLV